MGDPKEIRVLIVEDDPMVSEMFQGMLEDIGYQVSGRAFDGEQAIELAQVTRPDVILMDLEMSRLDGIEATRRIYACCPTPVVVVTAYQTPDLVKKASAAGAGAYLIKPPNIREIERAITISMARFEDILELRKINAKLQSRNKELQAALDKVKKLSGLLPICANCKKIRDDEGYWQDVAVYIQEYSDAEFSHGLCPDCVQLLYPEYDQRPPEFSQDVSEALNKLGWATVEDISAEVNLSESRVLIILERMARDRQVRCVDVSGQSFYKLL